MRITAMKSTIGARRWTTPTVAVIAAAIALLLLGLWWVAPWKTARPIMVTGTAYYTSGDQTAIGFTADSWLDRLRFGLEGTGFDVGDVKWTASDTDVWQAGDGPVECLTPLEATRVELSYVEVAYSRWHDGGPGLVVTSIRCLE